MTKPVYIIGTDTIGGLMIPAAFCGILGYRPSQGAVSTIGVLPNSQTLDSIGKIIKFFYRECMHLVSFVI